MEHGTIATVGAAIIMVAIVMCLRWAYSSENPCTSEWHSDFDEAIIRYSEGNCERLKIQGWCRKPPLMQIKTDDKVFCTHQSNVILIKSK